MGALDLLAPLVRETTGCAIPKVRVTCGFPSQRAAGRRLRRIGECWPAGASSDGTVEVSISPTLADPTEVIATLLHEAIHAVYPGEGHGVTFRRAARAMGLVGPARATTAGVAFIPVVTRIIKALGPYPHAVLRVDLRRGAGSRLRKVACSCGCIVRMTMLWLAEVGPPTCGCGKRMRVAATAPARREGFQPDGNSYV